MSDNKENLLHFLETASIEEPVAGAIEHLYEGGHLSDRQVSAIVRFTRSPHVDTRYEALLALVHYAKCNDLWAEATGLLVAGLIRDDTDAQFGAVSVLSIMASYGSMEASKVLEALKIDPDVRKSLQLAPPFDTSE